MSITNDAPGELSTLAKSPTIVEMPDILLFL
jgi:hypothetical protein